MTIAALIHVAHQIAADSEANHEPAFLRGMARLIAEYVAPAAPNGAADVPKIRHEVYVSLLETEARGEVPA